MAGLFDLLTDPQMLLAACVAIGVAATVLTVALPLLEKDQLASRMKAVALEREAIRTRERARLGVERTKSLRAEPKAFMKQMVETLNLKNALSDDKTADQLRMAGFRGQAPLTVYLFARFILPFACFLLALFYFFVLDVIDKPPGMKFAFSLLAAAAGMYLPNVYLKNAITKRQQSIKRTWPDADRKSTRLNSSHRLTSRMPSSA
jgi:tight adherence protein C